MYAEKQESTEYERSNARNQDRGQENPKKRKMSIYPGSTSRKQDEEGRSDVEISYCSRSWLENRRDAEQGEYRLARERPAVFPCSNKKSTTRAEDLIQHSSSQDE